MVTTMYVGDRFSRFMLFINMQYVSDYTFLNVRKSPTSLQIVTIIKFPT